MQVVNAGTGSTCAIANDRLWCWGSNGRGQLGNKTNTNAINAAVAVNVLQSDSTELAGPIKQVSNSVQGNHSCAIDASNQLWCWGFNIYGQLGIGTQAADPDGAMNAANSNYAQRVKIDATTFLTDITTVSTGLQSTCAIAALGKVYCWGASWFGETGQEGGSPPTVNSYATVVNASAGVPLTGFTKIGVGQRHSCGIKDGNVWCWGLNDKGELGNGGNTDSRYPVQVKKVGGTALTGVTNLSVGQYHGCATTTDQTMWCWGNNEYGQLGLGTASSAVTLATQVLQKAGVSLTGVLDISLGGSHTCARLSTGIWCWGQNLMGQLGDGTKVDKKFPVQVKLASSAVLSGVTWISPGKQHTCAVANSKALCWGLNDTGQLGDNTTTNKVKAIINGL